MLVRIERTRRVAAVFPSPHGCLRKKPRLGFCLDCTACGSRDVAMVGRGWEGFMVKLKLIDLYPRLAGRLTHHRVLGVLIGHACCGVHEKPGEFAPGHT